jgi:ABC-type phosphate/phosphonate transport system permease subunit
MACGFAVWFGSAYSMYSEISIATTGKTLPCMFGCLTSMFVPLPLTLLISFIRPDEPFDWDTFLKIEKVRPDTLSATNQATKFDREAYFSPERVRYMKRMSKTAAIWAAATFLGQVLLWPLPMYGARNIMSRELFIAWVVISLIWLFVTLIIANFFPLADGGFAQIWEVIKYLRDGSEKSKDISSSFTPAVLEIEMSDSTEKKRSG